MAVIIYALCVNKVLDIKPWQYIHVYMPNIPPVLRVEIFINYGISNSCSMVTSVHGICSPSVMYSRGCAQGNTLTRGLQMPCTNVQTMLQVTCILVVLTLHLLGNVYIV